MRTNHTMVNDRDALIIFGGINEKGYLPSDIYCATLVDRATKKKYDTLQPVQVLKAYFSKRISHKKSLIDEFTIDPDDLKDESGSDKSHKSISPEKKSKSRKKNKKSSSRQIA